MNTESLELEWPKKTSYVAKSCRRVGGQNVIKKISFSPAPNWKTLQTDIGKDLKDSTLSPKQEKIQNTVAPLETPDQGEEERSKAKRARIQKLV